jgi:cell division protein FtsI/penicillin-binding protein 2
MAVPTAAVYLVLPLPVLSPALRRAARLTAAALLVSALPAEAAPPRRRAPKRRAARPAVHRPTLPRLIVPAAASLRDLQISEAARKGLGTTRGAAVAMDPYTGRVIAVVNPDLGLLHAYQPCSVFKIVVAIAGLTEGVITPETTYDCDGGCWMWPGHGPIDLRRALAQSCNPYFEAIGEALGYETVQRYATLLGLGAPSGINVDGETPGRLPAFVGPSAVGHLSSHAKGISTSAIQLAVLLSATINGGVVYQPQVAGKAGFTPRERWRLPAGTVLGGLADGFLSAVNEGSAASAFDPEVIVAGKTGTCAGVGWFASYAPADRPEVVLVTFVRPGSGHAASAVAGRIYRELYRPAAPLTHLGGGGAH